MAGYFGTDAQRILQARAEAAVEFISRTPGACQAGRTMGCDQPDLLGWEKIEEFLARDRVCGFRLLPAGRADRLKAELEQRRYRFDTWDVFLAGRTAALDAADKIVSRGLPEGVTILGRIENPEGADTLDIQRLMAAAGVVPFSGSFLTGAFGPAITVALAEGSGSVVAAAHAYFPHNEHSAHHSKAWGGLVAVAETHRGRGLGAYVNALMIIDIVRRLGATHIYELVSSSNLPSRRMVEACGLRAEPSLVCGLATPLESTRFTR
jgi:hypothetical protein